MKLEQNVGGTRALLVAAMVLLTSVAVIAGAQEEAGFKVVVHQDNPATSLTREQLSRLFLKRDTSWGDGVEVVPIDLAADHPTRERFSRAVHKRPVEATKAYWQKQIFDGRAVPPAEYPSSATVLELVSANRGAVGYVDDATPLIDGVKVIEVGGIS